MDVRTLEGVRIDGLAACVPAASVPNEEKVAKATGIVARRVAAKGETVADLCVRAAERALADTASAPSDFGAVLCVSFTQHRRMPGVAAEAQARLGLPKGILAFDVSLACSGWAYGLYLAGLLVRETGRKVLLLDGDVQSEFLDASDRDTASLLSDAGTATVLSPDAGSVPWRFAFVTDGAKGQALELKHGGTIRMDGFGVFRFVATDVVSALKEFISQTVLSFPQSSNPPIEQSDNPPIPQSNNRTFLFVPHQPNAYMVRQLAKSVGIPEDRTALVCDELGNMSSASVPVAIAWKGLRGPLLVAGFGGGLSISTGLIGLTSAASLSVV